MKQKTLKIKLATLHYLKTLPSCSWQSRVYHLPCPYHYSFSHYGRASLVLTSGANRPVWFAPLGWYEARCLPACLQGDTSLTACLQWVRGAGSLSQQTLLPATWSTQNWDTGLMFDWWEPPPQGETGESPRQFCVGLLGG